MIRCLIKGIFVFFTINTRFDFFKILSSSAIYLYSLGGQLITAAELFFLVVLKMSQVWPKLLLLAGDYHSKRGGLYVDA